MGTHEIIKGEENGAFAGFVSVVNAVEDIVTVGI